MKSLYIAPILVLLVSCGQDSLDNKLHKLNQLRADAVELNREIETLEEEISQKDPHFDSSRRQHTLISTLEVQLQPFEHKFEVRASVASRMNVLISAEASGRVEHIYIREGDQVKKGQQLITLDASVLTNSIEELKTDLDLATTIYQKRERLWKQNIGSELQYLEAKNKMEALQRRLATTQAQLKQFNLIAPFSGVVENVQAKLGEMAMFGSPMLRILSIDAMHLEADVSEKYLGRLQKGDSVNLFFSSFNQELKSTITAVGYVINPQNRTFSVEVALPKGRFPYKPNLVAILKFRDYYQTEAMVVPSELIQQDSQGDFVYAVDTVVNELKAKKIHIIPGISYQSKTEVIQGIEAGTVLVNAGHREVTAGALVQVATRELL
jgi:RND family efflux transporter MFP subunit